MIKALFKFSKTPDGCIVIDTTSSSGKYRELSPFALAAPPAKNLENLWQFSKVYAPEHFSIAGDRILPSWRQWRDSGWADYRAHRYPMGVGRKPLFSFWNDRRLDYIEARKEIYAPEYAKNVAETEAYRELERTYQRSPYPIILLDYDAYDHQALGMSLRDVINNPDKKMGHAFVLIMMLTGQLEECLG